MREEGHSAEAEAKAALLGRIAARQSSLKFVASELVLDGWSIRADLVIGDQGRTHAYEIKTASDNLVRLPRQISSYRGAFDRVTAVIATRHLSAAMAILPDDVGIMELRKGQSLRVIQRRAARLSPSGTALSKSRLLPLKVLAKHPAFRGVTRRAEADQRAEVLNPLALREHLFDFLVKRYGATTQRFLIKACGGVSPELVRELHIWDNVREASLSKEVEDPFIRWIEETNQRGVFGDVPTDIRALLTA